MLTQLQSNTDTLIACLSESYGAATAAGKPCAYSANAKAFSDLRVALGLITTRSNTQDDNGDRVAALGHLSRDLSGHGHGPPAR